MKQVGGSCGKCGAPYYVESPFWSIIPPHPEPTCCCWNLMPHVSIRTTTGTMPWRVWYPTTGDPLPPEPTTWCGGMT